MIEKIQNLIEDNTSFDITRNQVIMGLVVSVAFVLLIIFFMFGSGGQKAIPNYVSTPPTTDGPAYQQ